MPSFDLCASTATRRNEVGAAGNLCPRRRCFWESGENSIGSSLLFWFCFKWALDEKKSFRRGSANGGET